MTINKTIRRNFSRVTLTLVLALLTTVTAWAYDLSQSGSCGTNASYAITGTSPDVLPCAGLTSIGKEAFNHTNEQGLTEVVCLTEAALTVGSFVFNSTNKQVTVYMLGSHKVNWDQAKAVKGLATVAKGDGVSTMTIDDSGAEKKTVNGTTYYVGGTTVNLTLASSLSGTVAYFANGQLLPVTDGHATLTIPNDVSTVTVTAMQVQMLTRGRGTSGDPYQISSVADWNTFASMINAGVETNKYYRLTTDIGTEQNPVTYIHSGRKVVIK